MLILFLLLWLRSVAASTSVRGKCALECYSRCMHSGAPSGVYCNCPVERSYRPCDSVDTRLAKASMVPMPSSFSSEYLDAHSIRLQIPPHRGAFAYVFEYATVSTKPNEWYFAGSSTNPVVTFTILDPCRDYKFRVLVVTGGEYPSDDFVIYSESPIPVHLPSFVLSPDQIFAEPPIYNGTTDSIKVYVRWTLPRGYSDSDIYGYEAPALYSLQCHASEDELPQPKIEIVRAGGRLVVTLPSSIVESRCRLWVEVRMLPRCVRVEPFNIQKNIEVDCSRSVSLEFCRKETRPICMEIEVAGRSGRANLTWLRPSRFPVYYHVRYGPAQMKTAYLICFGTTTWPAGGCNTYLFMSASPRAEEQRKAALYDKGSPPHVKWQLTTKRDIKVDGTATSLALDVAEDEDFGAQVCAVFNQGGKRPKFAMVPITPFRCTSCIKSATDAFDRCGECSRVDTSINEKSLDLGLDAQDPSQIQRVKSVPSQTVFRMETDLMVGTANHARHSERNVSVAQVNTHTGISPIAIEKAEEINELTSPISQSSSTSASTSFTEIITTTGSTTSPAMIAEVAHHQSDSTWMEASANETSSPLETSPEESINVTTFELPEIVDAGDVTVVDVVAKLHHFENEDLFTTTRNTQLEREEKIHESFVLESGNQDDFDLRQQSDIRRKQVSKNLEDSVKHNEEALNEVEHVRDENLPNFALETSSPANPSIPEGAVEKATTELENKLESSAAELGHHEKSKKCLLRTGIVCNFGCETVKTCRCPFETHVLSPDGGCVSRDSFGNIFCLPNSDVNATWDPIAMNVMVRNEIFADHIRSVFGADRLFVEFGRVKEYEPFLSPSMSTLRFDASKRARMVASVKQIVNAGVFEKEPFVFHVNESLSVADDEYGIRFCTFNSSQITLDDPDSAHFEDCAGVSSEDPYERDWDLDAVANKTGSAAKIVPISPVHFNYIRNGEPPLRPTRESYRNAIFVVGKVLLLVVLVLIMFVLVYLNCSRLKLLFDKKRTHYFRPYYIDPQVHVSPLHSYSTHTILQKRNGYYQTRTKVM